jgi:hypothetical protein
VEKRINGLENKIAMITSAARVSPGRSPKPYVRDEGGGGRPPAFLGRRKLKPDVTGTLLWFGGSVEVIDNEHVWQGPYRTCIKPIRILAAVSSHVAPNRVGLFSA